MITQEIAAYGYLISAICFIMALRGLSSPVTSRQGNLFGIVGMVVAIGVTVATPGVVSPWLIVGGLVVGGAVGAVLAWAFYAVTVVSLPMLVDRDVDLITAIVASVAVVRANIAVMLVWAILQLFLALGQWVYLI